ncbi:hypothetical protein EPN15_02565 [Patescibacteria group bacterium]|nr:MAG: hypothetical protein EPN15_02565 [Patescibacteria group bacterium]
MNRKSLDLAGHLTLAVSNFEKSKKFYDSLFKQIGFKQIRDGEGSAAWATREGFGIWIKHAKHTKPRYKYFAPGLQHLCVKAKTKKKVDVVYEFMSARKTFVFDKPKFYSEYAPNYYAVFFADPDGIKIEVAYY